MRVIPALVGNPFIGKKGIHGIHGLWENICYFDLKYIFSGLLFVGEMRVFDRVSALFEFFLIITPSQKSLHPRPS